MLLAETTLTWPVFAGVLGAIALILTVLEKAKKFFGGSPEKREVRFAEEFASRAEVTEIKRDVTKVNNDLVALKESIVTNGEIRRKNIEAKVESTRIELKGDIEKARQEMRDNCDALGTRMDSVAVTVGELRGEIKQALKDR